MKSSWFKCLAKVEDQKSEHFKMFKIILIRIRIRFQDLKKFVTDPDSGSKINSLRIRIQDLKKIWYPSV